MHFSGAKSDSEEPKRKETTESCGDKESDCRVTSRVVPYQRGQRNFQKITV